MFKVLGPDDPGRAHLDEFDRDDDAARKSANRPCRDIVDVEPASGILGRDILLCQSKDRSAGNDEEIPKLGEARDDVVGQAVGQPAAKTDRAMAFGKRHHRERSSARRGRVGLR